MTPAERSRVEWIAGKVMGLKPKPPNVHLGELRQGFYFWEGGVLWVTLLGDGARVRQLDPLVSISDAMAALEAWETAKGFNRSATLSLSASYKTNKRIRSVELRDGCRQAGWGNGVTLPCAICAALCAATNYEEPTDAGNATVQEATHED